MILQKLFPTILHGYVVCMCVAVVESDQLRARYSPPCPSKTAKKLTSSSPLTVSKFTWGKLRKIIQSEPTFSVFLFAINRSARQHYHKPRQTGVKERGCPWHQSPSWHWVCFVPFDCLIGRITGSVLNSPLHLPYLSKKKRSKKIKKTLPKNRMWVLSGSVARSIMFIYVTYAPSLHGTGPELDPRAVGLCIVSPCDRITETQHIPHDENQSKNIECIVCVDTRKVFNQSSPKFAWKTTPAIHWLSCTYLRWRRRRKSTSPTDRYICPIVCNWTGHTHTRFCFSQHRPRKRRGQARLKAPSDTQHHPRKRRGQARLKAPSDTQPHPRILSNLPSIT